jgi:hypothetical protein
MPRTTIDLAPTQYQFNDQPLLSREIWQSAQAIAQVPQQLAAIRMQQEDRAMEQQERTARMKHMELSDKMMAERGARDSVQDAYGRERQGRLDKSAQTESEHRMEMDRQRTELARTKLAEDVEKNALKMPAFRDRNQEARYNNALKMGAKLEIAPQEGEDVDDFAYRVEQTAAEQHNITPTLSPEKAAKMIPEITIMKNKMTPEDVAEKAESMSAASTPRAKAGKALGAKVKADPSLMKVPTLQGAMSGQPAAPAPAAAAPVAAPVTPPPTTSVNTPPPDPGTQTPEYKQGEQEALAIPKGQLAQYLTALESTDPDKFDRIALVLQLDRKARRAAPAPVPPNPGVARVGGAFPLGMGMR